METLYRIVLAANVLWFGAGCWYFWIKHDTAAKLLIPRSARSSPIFETVSAALPFLGGMNLAFCLLSALLLVQTELFLADPERVTLLVVLGTAHATQFAINVPVARRGGRIGESYWDVLTGPMLFIFVVDAALAISNVVLATCIVVMGINPAD
jgi:hypothetical protein